MMNIQGLSKTAISKHRYSSIPVMDYALNTIIVFEKKYLDLIK